MNDSTLSQYTTEIQYLPGKENHVADVLSRIYSINVSPTIDQEWIADLQSTDTFLQSIINGDRSSNLQLSLVKDLNGKTELWCDIQWIVQTIRPRRSTA